MISMPTWRSSRQGRSVEFRSLGVQGLWAGVRFGIQGPWEFLKLPLRKPVKLDSRAFFESFAVSNRRIFAYPYMLLFNDLSRIRCINSCYDPSSQACFDSFQCTSPNSNKVSLWSLPRFGFPYSTLYEIVMMNSLEIVIETYAAFSLHCLPLLLALF